MGELNFAFRNLRHSLDPPQSIALSRSLRRDIAKQTTAEVQERVVGLACGRVDGQQF